VKLASANEFEAQLGQCVSTGCTETATHAVLADWNAFTQRPLRSDHCETHGRSVAEGHIEQGIARRVYFVSFTELEEATNATA
jgi:hypothetical protein